MMKNKKAWLLAALALGTWQPLAQAQPANDLSQEFAAPSRENRPLTRWWVPGASMTKAEIRREIASMAKVGFGGAEVVPVAMDGGDGQAAIEWGTDAWKELTNYMLQVAREYDFTIDFTMTPAWPLALPTIKDVNDPAQGAQLELDGAWVDGITKDKPFQGELPRSAEAAADGAKVGGKVQLLGACVAKYWDKKQGILDYDSVRQLQVAGGKASFTPADEGEYVLFAWYQHPSGNVKYGNNQVDHFSKAGSQMIIDYWEQNLLPAYGDNFKQVRSLFIDSLEFETHLDWTAGAAAGFKKARGYDLIKYLPAVYDQDAYGNFMGNPAPDFKFNKHNEAIKNDYREYMTSLYIENHVKPLREFCHRHGVTLRYQTAYGKSLEVAQSALHVDVPETESLYGNDYLDFYRLQSGAAHIGGRNIYSLEAAAEWTEQWNPRDPQTGEFKTRGNGEKNCGNYQQTFQDHIWHDQRAFAAGVNQVVFHGYAYNGQYAGTGSKAGFIPSVKWPGFDGFSPSTWSNSFGERQPNWQYASTYVDFLSRNQYILRQGKPRVDLAVYYQSYYENIDFLGSQKILADGGQLEQHGYTYDFVSPAALAELQVTGGRLDQKGAAYKALILNQQTRLTDRAARQLVDYARKGLPIVIVGQPPQEGAFLQDKAVSGQMQKLQQLPGVITVEKTADIYGALQAHGILADAAYKDSKLLSYHRQGEGIDYYYIYNYGNVDSYRQAAQIPRVSTSVLLKGQGSPYKLNTWTGQIEPLTDFSRQGDRIAVKVDLAGNDSTIIALTGADIATVKAPGQRQYKAPIPLKNWELTVESWTKGSNPADMHKENISVGTLPELKPWRKIAGLEHVSGVGTYKTSFRLDQGQGAMLELGAVKDTFALLVNGRLVKMDPVDGRADITPYVRSGNNEIEIRVASTLLNAVLQENPTDQRETDDYGLLHPVNIIPFTLPPNIDTGD